MAMHTASSESLPVDDRVIATLLWESYDRIAAYINSLMQGSSYTFDMDDVLQETFIAAWKSSDRFAFVDQASLHSWLKTIARRKLIDRIRLRNSLKRGGAQQPALHDAQPRRMVDHVSCDGRSPSSEAACFESGQILDQSMSKLSERHQRALRYRFIEGKTAAEAAREMQISTDAFHMLSNRALAKLREAMGHESRFFGT